MNQTFFNQYRVPVLYAGMALLLILVGVGQGWSVSLSILNLCLISAIMALGVNLQWGYAGLFNAGIMGFAALGGLAAMLVSKAPIMGAWQAGGFGVLLGVIIWIMSGILAYLIWLRFKGRRRYW